ncbi:tyrosine-type recombinase/integrase [Enterococcus dongliensis]|uniref:tyrosine-type recombinase/integrase n=1 Tax=Enterococcus dongliensis TaxID=2559925 RepID=UPI00288FF692|nr:tyrosine-type recombinase/integrase [Enterococcus dongliensis]MDT2674109.1 tyrosine-type recombinase/integrase [Enterococcus dongliensis]
MKKVRLVAFFNQYIDTFKRGKISPGRIAKYELAAKYVEEYFGKKKTLNNLSKYNYQSYLNWLASADGPNKQGLSKTTVADQHTIFKTAILEAIDMGQMNPTRNVKITGHQATHSTETTLSQEDAEKLKNTILEATDTVAKYFCLVQFYTGVRYQEVTTLKWDSDIDEENEQIIIDEAFKYDGGIYRFGSTKTNAGYRKIDVHKHLFKYLKKWKASQAQDVLSGKLLNPHNLLFVTNNTYPISNSAVNKYLKYWCEKAEVSRIRSHSFRHVRSDFFTLPETDSIYIKDQLGYASIQQSYEYASATEERRQKNNQKFESFFEEIL